MARSSRWEGQSYRCCLNNTKNPRHGEVFFAAGILYQDAEIVVGREM